MDTGKSTCCTNCTFSNSGSCGWSWTHEDLAGCCDKGEYQQTSEFPGGHETGEAACPDGLKCLEVYKFRTNWRIHIRILTNLQEITQRLFERVRIHKFNGWVDEMSGQPNGLLVCAEFPKTAWLFVQVCIRQTCVLMWLSIWAFNGNIMTMQTLIRNRWTFHFLSGLCFRSSLQRTYRMRLGELLLRWLEIVWGGVEVWEVLRSFHYW